MAVRDDTDQSTASITMRLPPSLKAMIIQAARDADRSVTSFIVRAVHEKCAVHCVHCGRGVEPNVKGSK